VGIAANGFGKAKIQQLHSAVRSLQPEIGRLEVPVDESSFVGRGQSFRGLFADADDLGNCYGAFALEAGFDRFPLQVLHCQKWNAAILPDLVRGHDVVVADGCSGLRLAQKALGGRATGRQPRQHRFDGNLTLENKVFGLEDHPHAAAAKDLQETVRSKPTQLPRTLRWPEEFHKIQIV
jgi:hypothetical protein